MKVQEFLKGLWGWEAVVCVCMHTHTHVHHYHIPDTVQAQFLCIKSTLLKLKTKIRQEGEEEEVT